MRVFAFLLLGFLILSGCEGLPFTDEDTQDTTEQSSPIDNEAEGQNETEAGPDNSQTVDNDTPSERTVRINIEEREVVESNISSDHLEVLEEIASSDNPAREIKVSITDDSPRDTEEIVADSVLFENGGKTTEWTISRTETGVQQPVEASPSGDEANLLDEPNQLAETSLLDEVSPSGDSEPVSEEGEPISEEETTIISEDLKLTKDSVIQDRRVVLDKVTIKTFEHDLTIRAEEFVSNQAVIQNFPEKRKARKKQNGKNGGNIFIEAEISQGELQLILNGEGGGRVPRGRSVSRSKLRGQRGKDGQDAVYRKYCRDVRFLGVMAVDRKCRYRCVASPTGGQDGEDGQRGLPGSDGKDGGNAGSFHLRAYLLSDFRLIDVQNTPGKGSKGGKGSFGGYGGPRGRNGRDYKDICSYSRLPRTKNGKPGKRGPRGKHGKRGEKGTVCLEKLLQGEVFGTETEGSLICQ